MRTIRAALLLAIVFLLGAALAALAAPKIKAGQKAPDFALQTTAGQTVKLSDYQGSKVVLVEFFSVSCPWCAKGAPTTRKLYDEHKTKGLQLVAVNVAGDSASNVDKWVANNNYTGLPVLLDAALGAKQAYGVSILPTQVLVGKSGKVLQLYRGWLPKVEEALAQDVAAAVSGQPLPKHRFPLVGYG